MPATNYPASDSLNYSYVHGAAVTPHDTNTLTYFTKALYIGGAGDGTLQVRTRNGTTVAFVGLTANTILPISADIVFDTNTGVTNIVALY